MLEGLHEGAKNAIRRAFESIMAFGLNWNSKVSVHFLCIQLHLACASISCDVNIFVVLRRKKWLQVREAFLAEEVGSFPDHLVSGLLFFLFS